MLGRSTAREIDVDVEFLEMEKHDLSDLESIFMEEEVWNMIRELPLDRAPGPDGFGAAFYQRAWPIIKLDVMAAIMKLYVGDGRGFSKLNKAHIVSFQRSLTSRKWVTTGRSVSPIVWPSYLLRCSRIG